MNSRIFWVSLMGIALFLSIFYFAPVSLMSTKGFYFSLAGIVEVICSCFILERVGKNIITRPRYGLVLYQLIFILQANIYSLSLSFGVRLLLANSVTGIYGVSASSMLLLGCIVALSVFAFDLLVCFSFICTLLLPVIIIAAKSEATLGIAATYSCALMFFCYLGYILHRGEIALFQFEEKISEKNAALLNSNSALSTANDLFQSTLENIDEIFLLFNLEGICFGNSVARIASILGGEPNGKNLVDVLQLEGEKRENALAWFQMVASDNLDFSVLLDASPKDCHLKHNNMTFRLRFSQRREGEALTAVILTLTDVSEVLKLEQSAFAAQRRANFILAVSQSCAQFQQVLADLKILVNLLANASTADLTNVRFKLHTMKGASASFYLGDISACINEIELEIKTQMSNPELVAQCLRRSSVRLEHSLTHFLSSEADTLKKLKVFSEDEFTVSERRLQRGLAYVGNDQPEDFKKMLSYLRGSDLQEVLKSFGANVERLASRLQKLVTFSVRDSSDSFTLVGNTSMAIAKNLVHLLNNSLDHGIELPLVRLEAGKSDHGTVAARFYRSGDDLVLQFDDDGRGINVEAIKRKMTKLGIEFSALSEQEILNAIFRPDFSTAENLTDISGHGVGLAALHEQIHQAGGSISVSTVAGQGTQFVLRIPLDKAGIVHSRAEVDKRDRAA